MFGDRVARAVASRESQLVLGLDPDPRRLWPAAIAADAGGGSTGRPAERAADAVVRHCREVLEAVADECVGAKLQLACFERLGGPGWEAARVVVELAQQKDLLVIADAKRGDIDVTATAYAQAFFGHTATDYGEVPGLGVDAMTASPLLGVDSLKPLLDAARTGGSGVFVLVRTSNPGAADVQEQALATGGSVAEHLARMVDAVGAGGIGAEGLADVGAVVGATAPERLHRLRELMPRTILLVPGVGPQGGTVDGLAPVFVPGRAAGLLAVSRAIVEAHASERGDPPEAARRAASRLRQAAWSLSG